MIEWITRDWSLKLISLALAVGLWYYAVGEESVEVTRTIPLEIRVRNQQMSILKTSSRTVQVTLQAPRALLSNLASQEIIAFHEIGKDVKIIGDYSFRLEPGEVKLPSPQIRVLKIEPDLIHMTLDELIVQKLEIKPNLVGDPAFGYKLQTEEIQLDPNSILLEGPKGVLEKLDSIPTERIDLVGRSRSFRRTTALILPLNVKPLSESLVDVYVPIKEEFDEKRFDNIPVKILRDQDEQIKVEIEPHAISFMVKGSRRQLEKLVPEKILAYLDISSLNSGEHQVPVQILLPQDVSLKDEAPVLVKVSVRR